MATDLGCSLVITMLVLCVVGHSHATDCLTMAENGDCEFYSECVQSKVACNTTTDYPMGYAYRYCTLLSDSAAQFSVEGQEWVTQVKQCLMRALLGPINNPGITCSQLTKMALDSHVQCYLDSGPGLCAIIQQDAHTLCDVYEHEQVFAKYWKKAWKQVFLTTGRCYGKLYNEMGFSDYIQTQAGILSDIRTCASDKLGSFELDSTASRRRRRSLADASEVAAFAADGDCAFWEALDEKFACKTLNDWSLATSFLLPICVKFNRYTGIGPSSTVGAWMQDTQQCLMDHILPWYQDTSADCLQIDSTIQNNVIDCMDQAGFCDLDYSDEFFLDRGLNAKGFPALYPTEYTTRPITKRTETVGEDYFYGMRWFKALLADANVRCYSRNLRSSPHLYEELYSPTHGVSINFRTEL